MWRGKNARVDGLIYFNTPMRTTNTVARGKKVTVVGRKSFCSFVNLHFVKCNYLIVRSYTRNIHVSSSRYPITSAADKKRNASEYYTISPQTYRREKDTVSVASNMHSCSFHFVYIQMAFVPKRISRVRMYTIFSLICFKSLCNVWVLFFS